MSQHDFSIANQGFPSFRSDLNDALQALVSNSSGATAPSTTYAHQMWVDTTADPSILKIRNADNDAWITLGNIDQTGDTFIYTPAAGSASAPAYSTSGDLNTGVFFPGADIVALTAGGAEKLMASTSEVVVNDGSADVDFRVESDADTHALFVEGSSGNVGIGTSSPSEKLSVNGRVFVSGSGYITNPTGLVLGQYASNEVYIQKPSGAKLSFWDSATNAEVTIDSSGNLLVGTTSATLGGVTAGSAFFYTNNNYAVMIRVPSGGTYQALRFYNGSTAVGSVDCSGTTTTYNTASDYRLKEDWVAVADASTRVNALKPVNFAWKVNGSRVDGFLAHELAEVVPEAVTGEKDAVDAEGNPEYQGIDQSKLVPLLTAALQEALAEIESLKARLDAANL